MRTAIRHLVMAAACLGLTVASPAQIPYTLEVEEQPAPAANMPALHAYCLANLPNGWFIIGGRQTAGLHTFKTNPGETVNNFPLSAFNQYLWWFDANKHPVQVLDLNKLTPSFGDPLISTNQQCDYDASSGDWYIVGGYGMDSQSKMMRSFDTLTRIPAKQIAGIVTNSTMTAAQKEQAIIAAIQNPMNRSTNSLFSVTGGALSKMPSGIYLLLFGQNFQGLYNPFDKAADPYTNEVRAFQIKPGTATVVGQPIRIPSADKDQPYHRRDLSIVSSVDPASGVPRIAGFGGVFPPGIIGAYTYPVYVSESFGQVQARPDRTAVQRFSQYECPVVVVYDKTGKAVYYTFFGGIGHYYYFQSPPQKQVYDLVTKAGRNDGLPFTADITTLLEKSDGSYAGYIAPQPMPGNKLRGASVEFIPELAAGRKFTGDVFDLQAFKAGERTLIGYIYGGIDANFPLPCVPSNGTQGTNALYKMFLTHKPWAGVIPASQGHEAAGTYSHSTESTGGNPCPAPPTK